jgi:hypothetical protein
VLGAWSPSLDGDLDLSTKPSQQSTEGYAQGSRLSADRCASHERDGDAEQHADLPRFRPPCGRNTLRPALLCYCYFEQRITSQISLEYVAMFFEGVPCPSYIVREAGL